MSRLIGLGEGRTPAGDDYLVGCFAALWACCDASKAFATALSARLMVLATHTENLSRLYLEAAAIGEVSERIAAVATGIAAGSDDAARAVPWPPLWRLAIPLAPQPCLACCTRRSRILHLMPARMPT